MESEEKVQIVHNNSLADLKNDRVTLGHGLTPEVVFDLLKTKKTRHVVQAESEFFQVALKAGCQILDNPEHLYNYPLSTILTPEKISAENEEELILFKEKFSSLEEKKSFLMNIDDSMKKRRLSSLLIDRIMLVADELFTNVIFNSPETLKANRSRTDAIPLTKEQEASISIGINQDQIFVCCRDSFGTLDVKKFLERISHCLTNGVRNSIQLDDEGGAGIGSFLMFEFASSMVIGVQKNKQTLIGFTFPTDRRSLIRPRNAKSIHIDSKNGGGNV